MKYDIRAAFVERPPHRQDIAYVPEHCTKYNARVFPLDFHCNAVQIELAIVEHHQCAGVQLRDLPAKFRADGSTTTSNEYGIASDRVADALPIKRYGLAAEKIFDEDLAQLAHH
jgi:hypothetical protein